MKKKEEGGVHRYTINLQDHLYREIKFAAMISCVTMRDIVIQAIGGYLKTPDFKDEVENHANSMQNLLNNRRK